MRYIKRDRGMEKDLNWIANERGRERRTERGGPGFDSRCGRPLPTGWVGVSIM